MVQANTIVAAEARYRGEALRRGPSLPALRTLDQIHDRLESPDAYSWRQLAGAGALAGIGFTMSLFIAGQAFPTASDFAAAKIAVFGASVLSSILGVALLWSAGRAAADDSVAAQAPSERDLLTPVNETAPLTPPPGD